MSSALSIGLSAIRVNQQALDLIGQNISNANTPGYHRQVPDLAQLILGTGSLSGVEITNIQRLRSAVLEKSVLNNTQDAQDVGAQLDALQQVQSYLDPGTGSVNDSLQTLFNQFQQLEGQPADLAQRRILLANASNLANGLNSLSGNLSKITAGLDAQSRQAVDQVNFLSSQIADLNGQIQRTQLSGGDANDLKDQRDQSLSQLAELVDVRTVEQSDGQVTVIGAGIPLVVANRATALQFSVDTSNQAIVTISGSSLPQAVAGGKLAGFLHVRNEVLPDYLGRLNSLASALARGVDGIQATGLGLNGPLTQLTSERTVHDVTVPLSQAGLGFPPQAGTLTISITNLATGQRTTSQLAIDPATQSLQDLATALGGVGNLQASVDSQAGTLHIAAQPGFAFDFAGQLSSAPDTQAITGTTTPQVIGPYTGANNDAYSFRVVGSGTIGVTPNLSLEVRNSANAVIATLNIGQGYEPGSPLSVANGVSVQLASGTANDGDSFSQIVTAQSDTAGITTALGLNSFFAGSNANDIHVRADLLDNPELLAASRSGQPGDSANLTRLSDLANQPLLANGTQTFIQFYASLVGDAGTQVQQLDASKTAKDALGQALDAQRQSVSGVDPNEELVHMLQFQRAFELSARYVSVVNDTLNTLVQLLGTSAG